MKTVKKTDDYTIFQRRDGRYAVEDSDGKQLNGDDKVRILVAEELIKASLPAEPAEEPADAEAEAAEEGAQEEAGEEESAEEPSEEEPTEE